MAKTTTKTLRLSEGSTADLRALKALLRDRWPGVDLCESDVMRWAITTSMRVALVAAKRVHQTLAQSSDDVASVEARLMADGEGI
jgi:hypothetical protein